jgi:hypothetical protein
MSLLAREIVIALVSEFTPEEVLKRLSDPYWFQALGCILGFDWHSSGLTTTVTGALKEGIRGLEGEIGLFIAGGKGTTSRKTPEQIHLIGERYSIEADRLIYASRMSAKVDNSAVQDGYQLYHHTIFFTRNGRWAVVQQGMSASTRTARRYHWIGEGLESFVIEPHRAVCCDEKGMTLNMVASESEGARNISTAIARERPEKVIREIKSTINMALAKRHGIDLSDINPERLYTIFLKTYEHQPQDFESLLGISGVGPKTIRALSLVSELIYGEPPSYRDPARFSFAHGGKDGTPYPVDRATYDRTIEVMRRAINSARLGNRERMDAIRRLSRYEDRVPWCGRGM